MFLMLQHTCRRHGDRVPVAVPQDGHPRASPPTAAGATTTACPAPTPGGRTTRTTAPAGAVAAPAGAAAVGRGRRRGTRDKRCCRRCCWQTCSAGCTCLPCYWSARCSPPRTRGSSAEAPPHVSLTLRGGWSPPQSPAPCRFDANAPVLCRAVSVRANEPGKPLIKEEC